MTSPAKIRANRRNARRHGLTVPVLADPTLAGEVDALARRIAAPLAGAAHDAVRHALACRIAEAMIDLRRVRLAKLPLVEAMHADPTQIRPLRELARLDRYERHALWRRKTAVRAFQSEFVARIQRSEMRDSGPGLRSAQSGLRRRDAAAAARQNQRRNANDSSTPPHPSTAKGQEGKGCVPPRDPVGSPSW